MLHCMKIKWLHCMLNASDWLCLPQAMKHVLRSTVSSEPQLEPQLECSFIECREVCLYSMLLYMQLLSL